MGFVLALVSYVLFILVWIINFPIVLLKHVRSNGFLIVTNEYWRQHAVAVDIFGNYAYRATWNMLFRTSLGYRFGKRDETISSALGKNLRDGTLSWCGKVVCWILHLIDKKHCINSIRN